jgi:hypothetical protein
VTLLKRSSVIQPSISRRSDMSFESLLTELLFMLAANFKTRLREKVLFISANFHSTTLGTLEINSLHLFGYYHWQVLPLCQMIYHI